VRRTLIVLALAAGLVAACSGSAATNGPANAATPAAQTQTPARATTGAPSGAASALDPCSLITADEASAALGEPVKPASPGNHYCYWYAQANSDDSVEIYLTDPIKFLPNQSSISGVFEVTPATGVGDAAYYVNDVEAGTVGLNVKKGQTTFVASVALKGAPIASLEDKEKTLAIAVAGRV
jgi:hypothetical protein